MKRARACRIGALLGLWVAGCADSCSCGAATDGTEATAAETAAAAGAAQASESAHRPDAGVGSGRAAPSPSWRPAPDSELTRKLRAAKEALESNVTYPELAKERSLSGVLGDKLGSLAAEGDVSATVRESAEVKLAVAARNYRSGDKTVRVKVTDTGLLPNARRVVSGRLTLLGNAAVGNERGVFVRGYPGVVAHYEEQKVSRASAIVGERYLVQVMVRNAGDPDEALQVLERLDWSKLAPKQGKPPAPGR